MKKNILYSLTLSIILLLLYGCSDEKTITYGNLSISAKDIYNNSLLKGGQYQLLDKDKNVVNTYTLDNGIIDLTDVPRGFYSVKEIVSPGGYGYVGKEREKDIVVDFGHIECVFLYIDEDNREIPESAKVKFYSTDSKQYMGEYNAVRIGEYYWIDRNFSHFIPWGNDFENIHPMSQYLLDKYMSQILIDKAYFQVNLNDFEKYYGRYYSYPSVLYMNKYGQVHNEYNTPVDNWRLPYAEDYRQLFAMCPFNTTADPVHNSLNERDVRFALGAREGDNSMAFNITTQGPFKTYWFDSNHVKNMYRFNLMPGGARLNGDGPWCNSINCYNGKKGDIYHLFYTAVLATANPKDDLAVEFVIIHDQLSTDPVLSYHLMNVRWCRPLSDLELGYKLYINADQTDIKKLDLKTPPPSGYQELPHGYTRGFYVQYILNNPEPTVTVADIVQYARSAQDRYVNLNRDKVIL